jgi:hypothetical protein
MFFGQPGRTPPSTGSRRAAECRAVEIKEVEEGIWLVSFMDYDLGYIDLEEKTLQPLENPFAQKCNLCLQYDLLPMSPGRTPGFMERAMGIEPTSEAREACNLTQKTLDWRHF